MQQENNKTRRSVIQSSAITLGTILGGSSVVAANKTKRGRRKFRTNWLTVEDGRFVLNLVRGDVPTPLYELYRTGIDNFNAVIEAGHFRIAELDGEHAVQVAGSDAPDNSSILRVTSDTGTSALANVPGTESVDVQPSELAGVSSTRPDHQSSNSANASGVTAASCNRDDVVIDPYGGWIPGEVRVRIYLSDDTISDINAAIGLGGITGPKLYQYLVERGILSAGALSSAAASAIFVAVAAEWAWVQYANNGCGVIIHTGYSPVNPTYVIPTVEAQ